MGARHRHRFRFPAAAGKLHGSLAPRTGRLGARWLKRNWVFEHERYGSVVATFFSEAPRFEELHATGSIGTTTA